VFPDETSEHRLDRPHHVVQIDDPGPHHLPAGESKELAREGRGPLGHVVDLEDVYAPLVVGVKTIGQHVRVAQDGREVVVEVVRHSAGEQAHGFHLLRLAELLLHPPLACDVHEDTHDFERDSLGVSNQSHLIVKPAIVALGRAHAVVARLVAVLQHGGHVVIGIPIVRMDVAFPEVLVLQEVRCSVAKTTPGVLAHEGHEIGRRSPARVDHRGAQIHQELHAPLTPRHLDVRRPEVRGPLRHAQLESGVDPLQCFLGSPLFGHVPHSDQSPSRAPPPISDLTDSRVEHSVPTVRSPLTDLLSARVAGQYLQEFGMIGEHYLVVSAERADQIDPRHRADHRVRVHHVSQRVEHDQAVVHMLDDEVVRGGHHLQEAEPEETEEQHQSGGGKRHGREIDESEVPDVGDIGNHGEHYRHDQRDQLALVQVGRTHEGAPEHHESHHHERIRVGGVYPPPRSPRLNEHRSAARDVEAQLGPEKPVQLVRPREEHGYDRHDREEQHLPHGDQPLPAGVLGGEHEPGRSVRDHSEHLDLVQPDGRSQIPHVHPETAAEGPDRRAERDHS